ncbi:oxidoreductase [Xaviernesmea oryzae]|uniref:Oxidoreductase n=1 Tax=Xaviernesmea oryzae TaxID=464029 RepID=A0A1Q9AYV9_9HYPH|nr:Gfo/Idh/MocA family oxidoreductase [Xaviernesmea oryzae]OLP60886.1 oxidoreductase [Xaviernesmea oryzae]SEL22874.1 Predicted dehydrogenase [Xaviernesmea oryzae]
MNPTVARKALGVGVIGCGEIAQLMHLPILHELPGLRIAALCDLSDTVLSGLSAHYGVAACYKDYRDLLADPAVDAVVICTFDHGPVVKAAIEAGKHFIVEKPLAFTAEQARPLVAAAAAKGLVALVGYMKLYDPGYRLGLEQLEAIGRPKMIHVHDFAGRFDRYQSLYTQLRGTDIDPTVLKAGQAAAAAEIAAALGPDHAGYGDLYMTLLMLGSHDLAVLRGAFGVAERVDYAQAVGPYHILAVLGFPDGVPALLEVAFGAQYEWWDEWMRVDGEASQMLIEFQNPYVRNAAATIRLKQAAKADGSEGASERVLPGTPDTAFRRQWQHFLACIEGKAAPITPLQGGLDDLELAERIIKALPAKMAARDEAAA